MSAAEDRKYMGTPEQAEAALMQLARQWRELRQPIIATHATIRGLDARERECRFQLANAALLWLWHKENPSPDGEKQNG